MKKRGPALFCLFAGGGDAATGFLLLSAPALVLHLLGIKPPPGDDILLRFVGVFVGYVGLAYLYPWLYVDRIRRTQRMVAAVEITSGIRLAVASFLGIAVLGGHMELPWLAVGGYDAVVAVTQLGLLSRGFFGDAT